MTDPCPRCGYKGELGLPRLLRSSLGPDAEVERIRECPICSHVVEREPATLDDWQTAQVRAGAVP